MCYGYNMRMSREQKEQMLKSNKQILEERLKQTEQELYELEQVPAKNFVPQAA